MNSPDWHAPLLVVVADATSARHEGEWIATTVRVARAAAGSNVVVQVRVKSLPHDRQATLARAVQERIAGSVPLYLNGEISIGMDLEYDGIHLPEQATAVLAAPTPLPATVAAHSINAVRRAEAVGASAAIVSSVFEPSWKRANPLGTAALAKIVEEASIPVIALGGIGPQEVAHCLQAGASGVAVHSGIMRSKDPVRSLQLYLGALKQATGNGAKTGCESGS